VTSAIRRGEREKCDWSLREEVRGITQEGKG